MLTFGLINFLLILKDFQINVRFLCLLILFFNMTTTACISTTDGLIIYLFLKLLHLDRCFLYMFDMKLNIGPDVLFVAKPVNFIRAFNQRSTS